MNPLKILAFALIAGGVLALVYGSFSFVTGTHGMDLGVVDLSWKDHETVNVPVWAGVAGIVAGAVLLFTRKSA